MSDNWHIVTADPHTPRNAPTTNTHRVTPTPTTTTINRFQILSDNNTNSANWIKLNDNDSTTTTIVDFTPDSRILFDPIDNTVIGIDHNIIYDTTDSITTMSNNKPDYFQTISPEARRPVDKPDLSDVFLDRIAAGTILANVPCPGSAVGLSGFIDDDATHRKRLGLDPDDDLARTPTSKNVGVPATMAKRAVFKVKVKMWTTYYTATQQTIAYLEQCYPILKNKHDVITKTYPVNFTIMEAVDYLTMTYGTLERKQTATAKYAQLLYQVKFTLTADGRGTYLQQLKQIKFRLDQL